MQSVLWVGKGLEYMRKFNRPLAAVAGVGLSVLVAMGAPIGSAVTAVAAPTSGLVAAEIGVGSTPANPDGTGTPPTDGSERPDATIPPASTEVTPPGGGEGDGATNPSPPAGGTQSDDGVGAPSGDLTVGRPGPDLELGADSSGFMPMSVQVTEGGTTYHMPDAGRPYLAFEVKDTLANLVGGAQR